MNNEKNKSEIKEDVKYKFIILALLKIFVLILLMGLFGYVGYIYGKDNNCDIVKCVILGCLFPFIFCYFDGEVGFGIIKFFILVCAWILLGQFIPTFVGAICLVIVIILAILGAIQDYKDNISKYEENKITENKTQYSPSMEKSLISEEPFEYPEIKEEYHCERCFKKITEDEYELYDCMCEDCFIDVHLDEDGNFIDDIYNE